MGLKSFRDAASPVSEEAGDVKGTGIDEIIATKKHVSDHNVKNALLGTIGALLFALGGGVIWYLIYQTGFIVGAAGIVTIALALYGYTLFGNGLSRLGIVVSVVITTVVLFCAEYCCAARDIYETFQYWYTIGRADHALTFSQSIRSLFDLLTQKGYRAYGVDLFIGYGLSFAAGISYFFKRHKS